MTLSPIPINHRSVDDPRQLGYKPEPSRCELGGAKRLVTVEAVARAVDEAMIGKRVSIAGRHAHGLTTLLPPATGVSFPARSRSLMSPGAQF